MRGLRTEAIPRSTHLAACDRILPHAALMIREKCARLECDGVARRMWTDHADVETRGVIPCGLFLWCKLPDAIDAADVARRALADDVLFAPGNVFSVSQSAGSFMRFNVAMMEDPKIFRVLQSAMTECARTRISN